jgi:hypothetical protein
MRKYITILMLGSLCLSPQGSECKENDFPLIQYEDIVITLQDIRETSASLAERALAPRLEPRRGFDQTFQLCLSRIKTKVVEELTENIKTDPEEVREMYEKEYAQLSDADIKLYNRRLEVLVQSVKEAKQHLNDEEVLRSIYSKYESDLRKIGVPYEIWQDYDLHQDLETLTERLITDHYKDKKELINMAASQDNIYTRTKVLFEKLTKDVQLTESEQTLASKPGRSQAFALERKKRFVYDQIILKEILKKAKFFPNHYSQRVKQTLEERAQEEFVKWYFP